MTETADAPSDIPSPRLASELGDVDLDREVDIEEEEVAEDGRLVGDEVLRKGEVARFGVGE